MNLLTKVSLQSGTYSLVSFLSFSAVILPITRVGAGFILVGFLAYVGLDVVKEYVSRYQETRNHRQALLEAIAENAIDLVLYFLFFGAGLFLGLY